MATAPPVSAGGDRSLTLGKPRPVAAELKINLANASAFAGTTQCEDIRAFAESKLGGPVSMQFNAATGVITSVLDPDFDPSMHEHVVDSPAREGKMEKKAAKSKNNIPRPPNAFIIYRKDWHLKTVAAHPSLHNNEISKIIGKQWKNESDEVKEAYKCKAEAAKRQHLVDNPGYHYQPRKPSEKKKRMTKGKLAKLAAKAAVVPDSASENNVNAVMDHLSTGNHAMTAIPHSAVTNLEPIGSDSMGFVAGHDEYGQLAADLTNFNAAHPALPVTTAVQAPLTLNTTSMYDNVSAAATPYFPLDISAPDDLPLTADDFGIDFWNASAESLLAANGAGQGFNLNITPDDTAEVNRQSGLEMEALDFGTFFDLEEASELNNFI